MTMKKAILEWYEQLPEPIRSEAIANYDPYTNDDIMVSGVTEAITDGFTWCRSKQGLDYWSSILGRTLDGEFDAPVPTLDEELVSFGNYLLSDERNEGTSEINLKAVTHADIENWKLLKATK